MTPFVFVLDASASGPVVPGLNAQLDRSAEFQAAERAWDTAAGKAEADLAPALGNLRHAQEEFGGKKTSTSDGSARPARDAIAIALAGAPKSQGDYVQAASTETDGAQLTLLSIPIGYDVLTPRTAAEGDTVTSMSFGVLPDSCIEPYALAGRDVANSVGGLTTQDRRNRQHRSGVS